MDAVLIADWIQVAMPTGLIAIGVGFGLTEVWPYWKTRDAENRAHNQARDNSQINADLALAGALTAIAGVIEDCMAAPAGKL
ncbi:MAG: hypothetical protein KAR40_14345 [Candidatus Sabulitectum sp.]|nr:hypothetical protein [Candidatus Sabulitectum sp.]